MIKGKSPFPFETIALAFTFNSNLPSLVTEMKRLCTNHDSLAVFIHVGKKTTEKQRELAILLSANGFHDGNSRIYWELGEPVTSILRICKHEVADLLLIGASEKENFSLPIGQIATGIATKAKCSVLLFTSLPEDNGFKKIIVNGLDHKKTDLTILTSIYFGEKENIPSVTVADDTGNYSFEETGDQYNQPLTHKAPDIFQKIANENKVRINYISLAAEHSNNISEYAFREKYDLIVTHSSDHHLLIFDRIASEEGIESLLKNLPCSLLIVHSRLAD